jgi:hypothetical protein
VRGVTDTFRSPAPSPPLLVGDAVRMMVVLAGLAFVAAALYVAVSVGGAFMWAFVITVVVVSVLAAGSRRRRAAPK